MCQIKRGCKLTCGAPHSPLSGLPCPNCVLCCNADYLILTHCFQVHPVVKGLFFCHHLQIGMRSKKEEHILLYSDSSGIRFTNVCSLICNFITMVGCWPTGETS